MDLFFNMEINIILIFSQLIMLHYQLNVNMIFKTNMLFNIVLKCHKITIRIHKFKFIINICISIKNQMF